MNYELYNGDNLFLLENLPSKSIDLIYCDILYNTKKNLKDYNDNLGTTNQAIEWYKPRLKHMKRVLKETGLLYIQCDYNLSHYIKIELDNIFGVSNFRNEIIWHYNSAPRKKKDFGKRHDTIFRYSVSDNYYFDDNSKYIREDYSPTAPRGYKKEKYYDSRGKILDDVWHLSMLGQNDKTERVGSATQKPLALLNKIIDSSIPKGGVFADFFCGSGTSLVACAKLNKDIRAIGCDINSNAIEITKKRLNEVKANNE